MADERWFCCANVETIAVVRARSSGEARTIALLNGTSGELDDYPWIFEVHPTVARMLDRHGAGNVLDRFTRALRDVPVPYGYAATPASEEELIDLAILDFERRMGI